MSRRTKFILATVFALLLAIPSAYVWLTWSPVNPLRFHMLEVGHHARLDGTEQVGVRVEVGNTSATPVKLILAHVVAPESLSLPSSGRGIINSDVQVILDPLQAGNEEFMVPAHGTLKVWALIDRDVLPHAESGQLLIHYLWMSRAKFAADEASRWMSFHSPIWLQPHIPWIDHDEDDTPLAARDWKR